jgi:hypothetical protein
MESEGMNISDDEGRGGDKFGNGLKNIFEEYDNNF